VLVGVEVDEFWPAIRPLRLVVIGYDYVVPGKSVTDILKLRAPKVGEYGQIGRV